MPFSLFAIVLASLVGAALFARGRSRLILLGCAVLLVVTTVLFIGYLVLFGRHD
jgi:hypothetical protein